MSEMGMTQLSVGDRVIDTDDDNPDEAVVIARPPATTIAEWEFPTDEGPMTTADTNPEYPADAQLVLVSFLSDLNGYWEDWNDADPVDLRDGVEANHVHRYGFPEPRLAPADQSETSPDGETEPADNEAEPPEQFRPVIGRLEQNEFTVSYGADEQVTRVEKFGVEHTIDQKGTVGGESGIKNRVTSIVDRFL
ncbi:hypothetical protein ZOD2009_09735 [Haladaptatus paucihalophilus DX253]|uniref:Uncharacterized protein n=1 Tax=Haladaptatus paucihalophilus DX253 TaxID=797209 RepID=E7QT47_HALPU|nr:hypothetical protein [Haladaptatus paucihalophilus]EFW92328.1 hypothetical protein ZOD2009_09735 [Haladaptatus paucihalophilus DX253]SHL60215.1 hypothetical protein SAMN05444342_4222 [Haladaptatus paucihalophilus DX253]